MVLIIFAAAAQERAYWVVETNSASNDKSIVRIYGKENQLIGETTVDRNIDITRRKERKKLDQLVRAQRAGNTVAIAKKRYNKLDHERRIY